MGYTEAIALLDDNLQEDLATDAILTRPGEASGVHKRKSPDTLSYNGSARPARASLFVCEVFMSIESRRSTIQKLIISEGIAGRPIEDDAEFLSLAELWVHREIDMMEMRRLYKGVREERRRRKLGADTTPALDPSVNE